MRRFLIAWLSAALLIGLAVSPAAAKGPKCADILGTSADGLHDSRATYDGLVNFEVNGQFYLAASSCKNVEYTLFILDDETDTAPIASATVVGNGTADFVNITVSNVTTTDGDVCVYVQSGRGKQVLDRGPATGCVVLFDDGTSPGGGKGF